MKKRENNELFLVYVKTDMFRNFSGESKLKLHDDIKYTFIKKDETISRDVHDKYIPIRIRVDATMKVGRNCSCENHIREDRARSDK